MISDTDFYKQAAEIKSKITDVAQSPAKHLAIHNIQQTFQNEKRLYHWASDRRIPADNNLASAKAEEDKFKSNHVNLKTPLYSLPVDMA